MTAIDLAFGAAILLAPKEASGTAAGQGPTAISFLIGSWTCLNSQGNSTGWSVFKQLDNGRTLAETYTSTEGSRSTSTYTWDDKTKGWSNIWLSSNGWVSRKSVKVSKGRVEMVGTTYYPDGDKVSERETIEQVGPGVLRHTVLQSFDGKTWRETYAGRLVMQSLSGL